MCVYLTETIQIGPHRAPKKPFFFTTKWIKNDTQPYRILIQPKKFAFSSYSLTKAIHIVCRHTHTRASTRFPFIKTIIIYYYHVYNSSSSDKTTARPNEDDEINDFSARFHFVSTKKKKNFFFGHLSNAAIKWARALNNISHATILILFDVVTTNCIQRQIKMFKTLWRYVWLWV